MSLKNTDKKIEKSANDKEEQSLMAKKFGPYLHSSKSIHLPNGNSLESLKQKNIRKHFYENKKAEKELNLIFLIFC